MSLRTGDYRPRDAEHAVLYRVIDGHLDTFRETARRHADGAPLPAFVEQEFRDFLTCGVLARGFARLRCTECALERLVPFSCKGRGFCPSCGGRRMTEGAARLAICWRGITGWRAVLTVAVRVLLGFQRQRGRRGRDPWEADGVQADPLVDESPALAGLSSASVQGRIALGPRAGARVWRLGDDPDAPWVLSTVRRHAHLAGFDLHANVAVPAADRARLEQLCRYLLRPAVAQDRLRLLADADPPAADQPGPLSWRAGAALRLAGPGGGLRRAAGGRKPVAPRRRLPRSAPRHWAWAALMRRAFDVEVLACPRCDGRLRLIATIEDPETIGAILARTRRSPRSVRWRVGAGPCLWTDTPYLVETPVTRWLSALYRGDGGRKEQGAGGAENGGSGNWAFMRPML
jgi:hypothetical protein